MTRFLSALCRRRVLHRCLARRLDVLLRRRCGRALEMRSRLRRGGPFEMRRLRFEMRLGPFDARCLDTRGLWGFEVRLRPFELRCRLALGLPGEGRLRRWRVRFGASFDARLGRFGARSFHSRLRGLRMRLRNESRRA